MDFIYWQYDYIGVFTFQMSIVMYSPTIEKWFEWPMRWCAQPPFSETLKKQSIFRTQDNISGTHTDNI